MRDCYVGESAAPLRFFHICTDGTKCGIIHFDKTDYQRAISVSAVNSEKCGVEIICFCHMSSHSHYVVRADSYEGARSFIESCKHDYARYVASKHGVRSPLSGIGCNIKEITAPFYLKRCIAYVLLNPVAANIVKTPEEYPWSSFRTYFSALDDGVKRVSEMETVECRKLLHTKLDLKQSHLMLDSEGHVSYKSFVNYRLVEKLFGSQTALFKSLALTNSATEEELYADHCAKYDDTELIAEVMSLSVKKFGKTEFRMLTKNEKYSIIPAIIRKTRVQPRRLARILRVRPEEISRLLGCN